MVGVKVAYHNNWGSFYLSDEAVALYNLLAGTSFESCPEMRRAGIQRHDPVLVKVIERLNPPSIDVAELQGRQCRIDEYDGWETVEEPDDIEWIEVPQ